MSDKITIYDRIYCGIKILLLITVLNIIFYLTYGLSYLVIEHILLNFIKNGYYINRDLFNQFSVSSLVIEVALGFATLLLIYLVRMDAVLYTGVLAKVLQGLNLLILCELLMCQLYIWSYMSKYNVSIITGLKRALITVNYKIGVTGIILFLFVIGLIFIAVFTNGIIFAIPIAILFGWQLTGTKLLDKFIANITSEEVIENA